MCIKEPDAPHSKLPRCYMVRQTKKHYDDDDEREKNVLGKEHRRSVYTVCAFMACPFFNVLLYFVAFFISSLSMFSLSFSLKYIFSFLLFLSILILFIVFVAKHQANFSMCFPLPSHHRHRRACYCLLCCLPSSVRFLYCFLVHFSL